MDENTVGLTGSWDSRISRRTLLRTGGAAAVLLYSASVPSASAGPRFASDPFTLGVASGDPTPDGAVLWTRLAPDPLNGGGLGAETYRVRFEVAKDPDFRHLVHRGHTRVGPEEVHTVHAEVTGLKPGRDYWYRFESKRYVSPTGRLRTAPPDGKVPNRLRFAYVSCQNYTHGLYPAFEDLAQQEDVELVVHLGDYIYEGAGLAGGRPHAPQTSLMTLADYRTRHAQYKTDPALQAAHQACPWLMTWDDHEFWNNYADLDLDPNQPLETVAQRRAAAYLAYWEHSPLPRSRKPVDHNMPVYRRASWGDLVRFNVLDTRQSRSDQIVVCQPAQRLPSGYCPEAVNPARTILGEEQRNWLIDGLTGSSARWNVLANQVRFAPTDTDADIGRRGFGNDNWDGYAADRQRVLDAIAEHKPANPIVITGDAHVHEVRNVPPDFENFDAPPVATEFIGTSISTMQGTAPPSPPVFGGDANNPHRLFQCNQRGYVRVEVTRKSWTSEHVVVDATQEHAPASTIATFAVEDGQPGAIRVDQ